MKGIWEELRAAEKDSGLLIAICGALWAMMILGLWIVLPITLLIIHAPWWVTVSVVSYMIGRGLMRFGTEGGA